ncbi:hypothetical protein D3C85_1589740 [compost metagenome]
MSRIIQLGGQVTGTGEANRNLVVSAGGFGSNRQLVRVGRITGVDDGGADAGTRVVDLVADRLQRTAFGDIDVDVFAAHANGQLTSASDRVGFACKVFGGDVVSLGQGVHFDLVAAGDCTRACSNRNTSTG